MGIKFSNSPFYSKDSMLDSANSGFSGFSNKRIMDINLSQRLVSEEMIKYGLTRNGLESPERTNEVLRDLSMGGRK